MTTPTIPAQRVSPETVDICPYCRTRTRVCGNESCITAEIDEIVRTDRNEEACDDDY